MDKQRFEVFTEKLRSAFPVWTKIRKDPDAIGSQFLKVFGIELAEVERILNYALEQLYITTADLNQRDVIYKAIIPGNLKPDMVYQFFNDVHILEKKQSREAFLLSPTLSGEDTSIQYNTDCYIDYDNKFIYVHHSFNKGVKYESGHVSLKVYDEAGKEIHSEDLELQIHHIWNFFDEFGLLLNLPRLEGERNYQYRERILDVFRRPAGSHKEGLMNGIARELGLIYEIKWIDGGEDLLLDRHRIDTTFITVDNAPIDEGSIAKDRGGRIVLKGNDKFKNKERIVRYTAGVELHELHDNSAEFHAQIRQIDGTATPLLKYYVNQIEDRVPLMWGRWKWNQGFWDITDENMSGHGYIPNLYDASFSGWKMYAKEG